jgi:molecular chaperone GrpE
MSDQQVNPDNQTEQTQAPEITDIATLQARIDALEKEVAEHKDAHLRAAADYKNLKRRYEAERVDLITRASAGLLLKILPVVDDLARASSSATPEIVNSPWFGGFKLIPNKLQQLLESEGVTVMDALSQPFDPNLHEAVAYESGLSDSDGKVVAVLQKGYLLHDKVLRPAMVKVGQA